jgi:hypothetical protein
MKVSNFEMYAEDINTNVDDSTKRTIGKLFSANFPGMTEVMRHTFDMRRKIL